MKFINHNNQIIFSERYKASAIPVHIIGCEGFFQLFDTNTNMRVGRLEGDTGEVRFDSDVTFTAGQLAEIAELIQFIKALF